MLIQFFLSFNNVMQEANGKHKKQPNLQVAGAQQLLAANRFMIIPVLQKIFWKVLQCREGAVQNGCF